MELKLNQRERNEEPIYRFNRTFMELKHLSKILGHLANHRFNRTFMELKQPQKRQT